MQGILEISSFLVTKIHPLLLKKSGHYQLFNARYFGVSSFLVTKLTLTASIAKMKNIFFLMYPVFLEKSK